METMVGKGMSMKNKALIHAQRRKEVSWTMLGARRDLEHIGYAPEVIMMMTNEECAHELEYWDTSEDN